VDRPHYLRVVQALALVSGFGPVVIVVGAMSADCGSYQEGLAGPVACPEDDPNCNFCGLCLDGASGSLDSPNLEPADTSAPSPWADTGVALGCELDATGCDANVPPPESGVGDGAACAPDAAGCFATDAGADVTVADGSTDASVDGGPLPPPDLPA
jgi:hypothetical protein